MGGLTSIVAAMLAQGPPQPTDAWETADLIVHGRLTEVRPTTAQCDEPRPVPQPTPPLRERDTDDRTLASRISSDGPQDIARAEALYAEAQNALELGDYARAVDGFMATYRVAEGVHAVLFNVALAAHQLGDCELAREAYTLFIQRSAGSSKLESARSDAQDALRELAGQRCATRQTECIYGVVTGPCNEVRPSTVRVRGSRARTRIRTDPAGRFAVCGLPPDHYTVTAGAATQSLQLDGTQPVGTVLSIPAGWDVVVEFDHVHRGDDRGASPLLAQVPTEATGCVPPAEGTTDLLVLARRVDGGWHVDPCAGFVHQPLPGPPAVRRRGGCQVGPTHSAPPSLWLSLLVLLGLPARRSV